MAGLFTRNNLSEAGLNATDALQKLYGPQIQEDINLFAFSSRLESLISSGTIISENQIYGLVNVPISDSAGNISLRTRFVTNTVTFSDNNRVWIDRVSGYTLDKRTSEESSTGAPVNFSVNGSVVNASFIGTGTQYEVRSESGDLVSLPATVNVNLIGLESGSRSCVARVTVNADGTLSRSGFAIIGKGFGYIDSELLEPIPACGSQDTPAEDKCIRYEGNSLYHVTYNAGSVGYPALLKNDKYQYTVRFSQPDGFFLFDDLESKWLYLGSAYDEIQILPRVSTPVIQLARYDIISSSNLTQLYKLNARSLFFSYSDSYISETSISGAIRSATQSIEELKTNLSNFPQNVRIQSEAPNNLGLPYNILLSGNLRSEYRMIFRDPDSVLDNPDLDFFTLRELSQPGQVSWRGESVPGIWLFTGDKYQRVFSSDDKPFLSQSGRDYLSPILSKIQGGSVVAALESGDYKYGISAGYYKPNETLSNNSVRGFDTILGTLIQNISTSLNDGGFVYHRNLNVTTVRANIRSWPLFSYKEGSVTKEARFLAI